MRANELMDRFCAVPSSRISPRTPLFCFGPLYGCVSMTDHSSSSEVALRQVGLHGTDDSKSDEELVWRDTDWKTIPYREYPWTLSAMQASLPCLPHGLWLFLGLCRMTCQHIAGPVIALNKTRCTKGASQSHSPHVQRICQSV